MHSGHDQTSITAARPASRPTPVVARTESSPIPAGIRIGRQLDRPARRRVEQVDGADTGMSPKQHQRRRSPDDPPSTPLGSSQSTLPDGWKSTTLGALGHPLSGGTPSRSDSRFWGGDIPWVSSKDMKAARLHDSLEHVTPLALGNGTKLVQPGTILMVVRGMSLAHSFPVAIVEEPVAFNQDLKALVLDDDVDAEYILRWLQANQSRLLLLATEASHGTKRIPTGDLLATSIFLPQLPEQREIAKALADVNDLLEALEAMIAKKQAIKRGAIQQLLTGSIRLPGFGGNWESVSLGKTVSIKNGATPNTRISAYWNGSIPWCTPTDITDLPGKYLFTTERRITPEGLSSCSASFVPAGALLLCSRATIGEIKVAASPVCTNQGIKSLVCRDGVHSEFLYYLIVTLKQQMIQRASGSTFLEIGKHDIASIDVELPSYDEQHAISAVLSDMDTEIDLLERRHARTCGVRQGMLQQLLTGRVRLTNTRGSVEREQATDAVSRKHNWQFDEAVVISVLARNFGTDRYPLGRMRYTKLLYLFRRYKEGRAEGYLKKAAGPYKPRTRYGGPERIAVEKKYIRQHKRGKYQGFVAASYIREAIEYFDKWYGTDALQWLEQFRYKKNDELELLTTVDMAAEELRTAGKEVSVENVKDVILGHREWKAKMDRRIFADANVSRAIEDGRTLFAVGSERDTA